jgi:serpin B
MKLYSTITALPLLLALLPVFTASTAEDTPRFEQVAEGNNEFAMDLYRKLATPGKNLFISPLSIGAAFAMADAGARGATQAEIEKVMRFRETGDSLARSWGGMLADLSRRAKAGRYRLSTANRIWIDREFRMGKDFSKTMKKSYDAGVKQVNFSGDPEGSRTAINDWVADQTNKKITGLIPDGGVTSATSMVLANAVYFMGDWENPFDEKATVRAEFFITPAKKAEVPMMKQTNHFRYAEYDDLSVVLLPYKTAGKGEDALSLLVFLPKKMTGLADIERKLAPANWRKWTAGMSYEEVVVELPRFEVTSFAGLSETMKSMGMKAAFSPDADFSGIAPKLGISEAFHKAYVSVNEKGTEAAAATAIMMVKADGGNKRFFRADHPFLFAICDNKNGAILFIGRVADPLLK